jgi:hypothetical protein
MVFAIMVEALRLPLLLWQKRYRADFERKIGSDACPQAGCSSVPLGFLLLLWYGIDFLVVL